MLRFRHSRSQLNIVCQILKKCASGGYIFMLDSQLVFSGSNSQYRTNFSSQASQGRPARWSSRAKLSSVGSCMDILVYINPALNRRNHECCSYQNCLSHQSLLPHAPGLLCSTAVWAHPLPENLTEVVSDDWPTFWVPMQYLNYVIVIDIKW